MERNRISSLQSHGKALEKECCLPGVFCDSGDTPANYCYLLHHKVAHGEYNITQQNAKTIKQYDAKMHKRVSAIRMYKYT